MARVGGQRVRSDRVFERLYRRYVGDVYRYAFAVLANPADAEDVTQTAFLNAYRAFQSGQRPEKPLNWLIAIAHNVCRQRFRDAARRPSEVVLDPEIAAGAADDGENGFRREDIRRALSHLKLNQRAALAMRELEGRSYREIAEILGISAAAVETLIFRARRAFREQLEGTLSCTEAERAISRQLDGMLARDERGALRAHLRECAECAALARRYRAQRAALRGSAIVPLPPSLWSFSATGGSGLGGAAAIGGTVGIKAAALGAAALLAAGVGSETTPPSVAESAARTIVPEAPVQGAQPAALRAAATSRPATRGSAKSVAALVSVKPAHVRLRVLRHRQQPVRPRRAAHRAHPVTPAALPARGVHPLVHRPTVVPRPQLGSPAHRAPVKRRGRPETGAAGSNPGAPAPSASPAHSASPAPPAVADGQPSGTAPKPPTSPSPPTSPTPTVPVGVPGVVPPDLAAGPPDAVGGGGPADAAAALAKAGSKAKKQAKKP